jgi:hypothetical protein
MISYSKIPVKGERENYLYSSRFSLPVPLSAARHRPDGIWI